MVTWQHPGSPSPEARPADCPQPRVRPRRPRLRVQTRLRPDVAPPLAPPFSAAGLLLTMSHSWAPGPETQAPRQLAVPRPDILGNVELLESKGNKSFANVNTNACGKGLVLPERLRILGAHGVTLWQGVVLGCHGNGGDKIGVLRLVVALTVSSSTALGWRNVHLRHLDGSCLVFCSLFYVSLQISVHESSCTIYFLILSQKGRLPVKLCF